MYYIYLNFWYVVFFLQSNANNLLMHQRHSVITDHRSILYKAGETFPNIENISKQRIRTHSQDPRKMLTIPKVMRAAVVEEQGKIVLREVPVPEPGRGEVLIKVITVGVCHSDLHAMNMDWIVKPVLPIIPGHEGAGVVVKLGEGVKSLKV